MQKKILTSSLLLLASALPLSAHALGLGNIEVYSALNQPLDAEITITSAKPGETENLIVQLASEQAFIKAGVQRPYLLNSLDFQGTVRQDGTPIVKVSTKKPVREPFLNFLVDVEWPRGRLVREFTLLLDPPGFAINQPKAAPAASSTQQTSSTVAGSAPIERQEPQAQPEPAQAAQPEPAQSEPVQPEPVQQAQAEPEVAVEPKVTAAETQPEPVPESFNEKQVQPKPVPAPAPETSDSPFADLLSDLEDDQTTALDDGGYAVTEQPAEVQSSNAMGAAAVSYQEEPQEPVDISGLDAEGLPTVDVKLDPNKAFNAETIVASDEAYIGPDIERLFQAQQEPVYREPAPEPAPEPIVVEPQPLPEPDRPTEYAVQKGDIMLDIAEEFRPQDIDINQAMLAIMRANPEAFIQENVNLVREGQVLRIPDQESMRALGQAAALSEVLAQNSLWREYKAQVAGASVAPTETASADASSASTAGSSSPTEAAEDGTQLSLVAPDEGDTGSNYSASGQEGDSAEGRLKRDLSLAKEDLEASKLEKDEVESRISELEGIVTKSEGIIELENEKMAQVQQNSEKANESGKAGESETEAFVDDAMGDLVGDGESTEQADPTGEADDSQADVNVSDAGSDDADVTASEPEQTTEVADSEAAQPTSARPDGIGGLIYDYLPEGLRPSLQPILAGPLVWALIALPIILVLALIFLLLRKKSSDASNELDNIVFDEGQSDSAPDTEAAGDSADEDLDATIVSNVDDTMQATAIMTPDADDESQEVEVSDEGEDDEDVQTLLAEADVYIAYGLVDQAEEELGKAIAENPDVPAYRGKLLEAYYNAGKKEEFIAAAQELEAKVDSNNSRVWDKAVVLGKEIAPEHALFSDAEVSSDIQASDFEVERPDTPDFDIGADEGGEVDLSSASISDDVGDESQPEEAEVESDDITDGVSLDDEFSLGDVVAELDGGSDDNAGESEEDDGELDFDVEDFLSDSDEESGETADSDDSVADIDLNLDDEEDEASAGDSVSLDFDMPGESDSSEDDSADLDLDFSEGDEANSEEVSLDDNSDDADGEFSLDLDESESDDSEASEGDMSFDLDDLSEEGGDSGEDDFDLDFDTGEADGSSDDDADSTRMIDDADLETMMDDLGEEGDIADFDDLDGDLPDNLDEVGTKLDLAKAYIDMGDSDGAKASLEEVIEEGSDEQKKAAEELLSQI